MVAHAANVLAVSSFLKTVQLNTFVIISYYTGFSAFCEIFFSFFLAAIVIDFIKTANNCRPLLSMIILSAQYRASKKKNTKLEIGV